MYKSKLQEFCQQKRWGLPKYSYIKDGPDHNPSFKASVTVNGSIFEAPNISRSSKEAENAAAKVAVHHFTSEEPIGETKTRRPRIVERHQAEELHSGCRDINSSDSRDIVLVDELNQYKMMLQTYAQRNKLGMPAYTCERKGPPHALWFKATVTLQGHSSESPGSYKTLKEAENAAAQLALLSLSSATFRESGTQHYKNLLQELAQNEGFILPKYKTKYSGEPHNPSFTSTVEIEGEVFHGTAAKSKKQAECNAAKAAYTAFMERKTSRTASSSSSSLDYEANEVTSGQSDSILTPPDISTLSITDSIMKKSDGTDCYLLCNRFKVYTSIPDIELPKGTVLLPIEEDKWVAVSLEFSNEIDA